MGGCVLGFVDVRLRLEVLDADFRDILLLIRDCRISLRKMGAHLHIEIRVHEHLELKVLLALILHLQRSPQTLLGESDTIHETKLKRPGLLQLVTEHRMRQTKVELDSVVPVLVVLA